MIKINQYLSIGDTAEMLGVSVPTVRRWQRSGKIKESHRTAGNHRRFCISEIRNLLGTNFERQVIGYARVSSYDQKSDLITQAEHSDDTELWRLDNLLTRPDATIEFALSL